MSTHRLATTLVVAVLFLCAVSCQMAPTSKAPSAAAPAGSAHLAKASIPAAAPAAATPAAAAPTIASITPLHSSPELYMIVGIFLIVGFGLAMVLVRANRPIERTR